MAERPERQEDFDAAWARIVADLTQEPAGGSSDGESQASGPTARDGLGTGESPGAGTAAPAGDVPGPGAPLQPPPTEPDEGLARLFEPLRRARAEPPRPPADAPQAPDAFVDNWEDEGHFTPPEPPELPAGTPVSRLAWAAMVGGPVVLLLITLTGWDPPRIVGISAGLAFLAGFATLVWLLPESREDGWDDGARL